MKQLRTFQPNSSFDAVKLVAEKGGIPVFPDFASHSTKKRPAFDFVLLGTTRAELISDLGLHNNECPRCMCAVVDEQRPDG
ncbi:Unannotated [Lentimonas sp. CC4]|nr:Unannotated [Lentimonas sp. CC4]CAA6687021.1 Unannotated [Lentimonas sp. CC6]CAA7075864.1 Unannotated [Lentimonas sp. CC4]CAA7172010.1 Unannotated [Lentimonas sp. CC21]CAA7182927.1 Unannotated [Lentimonas sp. CC8]